MDVTFPHSARAVLLTIVVLAPTAACNLIFGQTDLEVVGSGGASATGGSGTGGVAADCPDGEQDHDADGTCAPECGDDDCSGNGSCDDSSGTATCTCEPRFDGADCSDCAAAYDGMDCLGCADGYQDDDDDGVCDPACTATTCSGNGTCADDTGALLCTCRPTHTGSDCGTACATGTGGPDCAYTLVYGLDISVDDNWAAVGDVPYDVDESANVGAFDRVAYRLVLDDEEVWAEMDAFTADASMLGMPVDWIWDQPVTNVTVLSFAANQPSIATPTDGNIEMWSHCYGVGANGVHDYDDDISMGSPDCYGCLQVHADMSPVLAFNRWSRDGDNDIGLGPRPVEHPDWTWSYLAGDFATRRLEVYVRE